MLSTNLVLDLQLPQIVSKEGKKVMTALDNAVGAQVRLNVNTRP
jgi:hypothetical protein